MQNALELAELLEENDRAPQAVELLASAMLEAARQDEGDLGMLDDRDAAVALLGLYHRAGRHADVLELLEASPFWGAADLIAFAEETDYRETPVAFMAAAALQGRRPHRPGPHHPRRAAQ